MMPQTVTGEHANSDDPAQLTLYTMLKNASAATVRGSMSVDPKLETQFVLQVANIYDRMGCDLLALELVRNWDFTNKGLPQKERSDSESLVSGRLARRNSVIHELRPKMEQMPSKVQSQATAEFSFDSFAF